MSSWFDRVIAEFCSWFEPLTFFSMDYNVRGLIAVVLVSLICGAVGSLVVGNRMAFFSDALAHCAFAGVSLGILLALVFGVEGQKELQEWITPIMVGFGVLVGLLIAFVREKSRLASDTVIGVFFAGAVGLGAVLLKFVAQRKIFNPENFLFGDFLTIGNRDLLFLLVLLLLTGAVLWWMYNDFVLASFNPSLALSRRVRVRLCNYGFIVLLAIIVNVCLQTVGVLLINAMLIVPAATAALLCRNLRQVFWTTIAICLFVGMGGVAVSWNISLVYERLNQNPIQLGSGGVMVVLSVLLFGLAMLVAPVLRGKDR